MTYTVQRSLREARGLMSPGLLPPPPPPPPGPRQLTQLERLPPLFSLSLSTLCVEVKVCGKCGVGTVEPNNTSAKKRFMFNDIIPVTLFNLSTSLQILSISTSCPLCPHSIPPPPPTTSYSSSPPPLSAPPQIKHLIDALDIN
jgi:hypothetical protein